MSLKEIFLIICLLNFRTVRRLLIRTNSPGMIVWAISMVKVIPPIFMVIMSAL